MGSNESNRIFPLFSVFLARKLDITRFAVLFFIISWKYLGQNKAMFNDVDDVSNCVPIPDLSDWSMFFSFIDSHGQG
jgi:hypothetical protein